MTRHFGHELAIVAIVCVVSIFLFPAAAGSYSAVHGPVTSLQAMRNALRLRWAIAMAGLSLFGFSIEFSSYVSHKPGVWQFATTAPPAHSPLLRC
jgi:hypothetical protein